MPRIKCQGITNPEKGLGVVPCQLPKSRRAGMLCADCKNEAIRILHADSAVPAAMKTKVQQSWDRHLEANEGEKKVKNRGNRKRREADGGTLKR